MDFINTTYHIEETNSEQNNNIKDVLINKVIPAFEKSYILNGILLTKLTKNLFQTKHILNININVGKRLQDLCLSYAISNKNLGTYEKALILGDIKPKIIKLNHSHILLGNKKGDFIKKINNTYHPITGNSIKQMNKAYNTIKGIIGVLNESLRIMPE